MNKKGITQGMVLLIGVLLVVAYVMNIGGIQDWLKPEDKIPPVTDNCPSSGLTEVTINTQEALASSPTDANASYFVYKNGVLAANGVSGSDGASSFDIECGKGKTYSAIVLNTQTGVGFYAEYITIEASGPTDVHNLQMYEYGEVNFVNLGSGTDPSEGDDIAGASGKLCEIVATITENESVAAFRKPTMVCQVNTTAVEDVTFSGTGSATAPTRLGTLHVAQLVQRQYAFEITGLTNDLLKSTDSSVKLTGKIKFKTTNVDTEDRMTCVIVDQVMYRTPDYKTLSLSEGFLEGAEDADDSQIGAPDSWYQLIGFNDSSYC